MVTEGKDTNSIPRKSIADGEHVPNVAIFLRRTALEFLQIIFSTRAPGSFKYDEDDTKTEIQISDVHAVDLETVNQRPAIIGVRGPISWQGQGLGGGAVEARNVASGAHVFNDLLTGSVAFSCLSREGIEAEQIGHLVFNSFKFFRPTLQKFGFFSIKSLNIGAEALIEQEGSDDKTTIVPVYVTAQIQDRWSLDDTTGRQLREVIVESLTTNP